MANKELYRLAKSELVKRGLHKGNLVNPYTGKEVCAFGACATASGYTIQENQEERWSFELQDWETYTRYTIDDTEERELSAAFPELGIAAAQLFPEVFDPETYFADDERDQVEVSRLYVTEANDENGTTQEQVEAIFDLAIELAKD